MGWIALLVAILFVVLCLLIMGVVLLQPGQSEGLAGTFGSGGMLGSAFGVHMKNRLAKFTTILVILFFVVIFGFAMIYSRKGNKSRLEEEMGKAAPGQEEAPGIAPTPTGEEGHEGHDHEKPAPAPTPEKTEVKPPAKDAPAPAKEEPAPAKEAPKENAAPEKKPE